MRLDIRTDFDQVEAALNIAQRQVPFALSRALNLTGRDVINAEREEMSSVFDRPTPFTLNSLRLSAEEFAEWFVYMSHEELLPDIERIRHAQVRAAVLTAGGVSSPRGHGGWGFGDLMTLDAWPEPKGAAPELPLAKQIAHLNGWIK